MLINTLPPLIKNVTCAVTGHRVLSRGFDREKLKAELKSIIDDGYEYFLIGMAVGFDSECFAALEELRTAGEKIKIVAVVPCGDQSAKFRQKDKAAYAEMLKNADITVKETAPYFDGCMLARNDFLVENSSLLFAGWRGVKAGGTYYTVKKAEKAGVRVKVFNAI